MEDEVLYDIGDIVGDIVLEWDFLDYDVDDTNYNPIKKVDVLSNPGDLIKNINSGDFYILKSKPKNGSVDISFEQKDNFYSLGYWHLTDEAEYYVSME